MLNEESSSEDETMLFFLIAEQEKRNKGKRKRWVHQHNAQNSIHGTFVVTRELCQDPAKFHSFYRMSPESFDTLKNLMSDEIRKKDTNCRRAVCVEERLLITLRYLAVGASFRAMSFHFMRGETTIGQIVGETCAAMWHVLKDLYMPPPTKDEWTRIANEFLTEWQMPNCIGSIDGKHVRIRRPSHSGSGFFNYLSYFSVVLLAVVDAKGLFTVISVGEYGRNSDGGVLRNSNFGHLLKHKGLNIPTPQNLPGETGPPLPYYFVADEAFPLMENLMRPFPSRGLDDQKRVFNYRLSRARKTVECAFGRLASKFRIFSTPICCSETKIDAIVKAACILHNFIARNERLDESLDLSFGNEIEPCRNRSPSDAIVYRDILKEHLNQPHCMLPWQAT